MTTLIIDDILPRTQETATGGQTVFDTNWTVDDVNDVVVYARPSGSEDNDKELLISDSNYNVTLVGGSEQVRVTFLSGRTAGDIVTITRATPADRDNFYTNTNFTPEMLNADFARRLLLEQENELARTEYIPRYNTSAVIQQPDGSPDYHGQDIILPILPANSVWVKNNDNNEIEARTITDITPFGDVDFYTVTDQTSILPNSVPIAPFATGFLANVNGSGITSSRTMTGTSNEISVANGNGSGGNPTFRMANNPIIPGNQRIRIPAGTTAQRPGSPANGDTRYNTSNNLPEWYQGSTASWLSFVSIASPPTTDNAIVRWDGVNGDRIQNSLITIDDSGTFTANNAGANFFWGTPTAAPNNKFLVTTGSGSIAASTSMTASTSKIGSFDVPHYDNAEEPMQLIRGATSNTNNFVTIGGGGPSFNAATRIEFYTAANNTTLMGTSHGRIDSAGNFLWHTNTPATNSNFNILNSTNGIITATTLMTDTTDKQGGLAVPHYTNTEEPFGLINGVATSLVNTLRIGGGYANANTATTTRIYAAANNTTTTGTEIIRFSTNGWSMNGGTDFFDVYEEEETHSPVISFLTPGTSSISYSQQFGRYTITGNTLFYTYRVVFTPTLGTASGNMTISIPVTALASMGGGGGPITNISSNFSWNSRTSMTTNVAAGNNYATARGNQSGASAYDLQASDLTNGVEHTIQGFATYFI